MLVLHKYNVHNVCYGFTELHNATYVHSYILFIEYAADYLNQ